MLQAKYHMNQVLTYTQELRREREREIHRQTRQRPDITMPSNMATSSKTTTQE